MKTFVVRVFVAADGSEVPLCGVVDAVGSGRPERFRGGEGLLDVVRGELDRARRLEADAGQEGRPPPAQH